MTYRWPEFSALFGKLSDRIGFESKSYFFKQYIRFTLRNFLARKQISPFVDFVNQHPRRIALFSKHLGQDYWIVSKDFLNAKFCASERLKYIKYNLIAIEELLSDELFYRLLNGEQVVVYTLSWGLECVLTFNGAFEEGFLAIRLRSDGLTFYHCSIAFAPFRGKRVIFIPCMQGLGNTQEVRNKIKESTKKNFGIRPQNLLLETLRILGKFWGDSTILAVRQTQQVRYKPLGKRNYFVDYDEMWKDLGGELDGEYYKLIDVKRKDLNEIPSQKRSMYKKRFALLEELQESLGNNFRNIGLKECL
ncbi:DUF535 domain-containing protein [Helicobacter cholecystus]|uniref:DUF535 domain-containing protein n=1 Tax=Helicobacter cholecystus TaxID=45498 RepID=A0A3D8IU07_9HELI|nr:DUF535 family protein [Helicobacter cholecystus]RDU68712.1 DUF535 domain-containing protein [Helicobacter cholecystus]VEJ26181.1 Protein of uncharacterised function (DUF535) [Helicobacter cholecystus]